MTFKTAKSLSASLDPDVCAATRTSPRISVGPIGTVKVLYVSFIKDRIVMYGTGFGVPTFGYRSSSIMVVFELARAKPYKGYRNVSTRVSFKER